MSDQYAIIAGDEGWRVAAVGESGDVRTLSVMAPEDAAVDAPAEAAAGALRELGYAGEPAVLAVPSSWCLCAEIATDDLQRGGRRKAMAYRLEEHLPVSAEDFVADYVPTGTAAALGVCAELETLRPIVSALEAGGVHVRHICPTALLAAAWAAEQHPEAGGALIGGADADASDGAAPSPAPDGCDLVRLREGEPTAWAWIVEADEAVRGHLEAWETPDEGSVPLILVGAAEAMRAAAHAAPNVERIELDGIGRDEAAARRAARVAAGAASPWIDLRRDALAAPGRYEVYRKPMTALVAAVSLLLAGAVGVMIWRGMQYEALADSYVRQQAEVFRKVLPDQRVPAGVKGRLASERRKLEGLGGHASDEAIALQSVSALAHLREVLGRLPTNLRYRILDLNVQPDRIRIDGQARSHAEAERLAVALRESDWYDVQPPKTEALKDRGVSFLFTAEPRRTLAPSDGNAE